MKMSPLPILTLLMLLLSGSTSSFVYLSHTIAHASTPLKTFDDFSITLCAVCCRMTQGCIKWSHDEDTRACKLWPLHSAENPLTTTAGLLYQPSLPEGFIMSDDPTIAYKQRAFSMVGGFGSITSNCQAYDPEAFPAFPNTQQKINYIKANVIGTYFWVGMSDQETEGVWKDMTTGQEVDLPNALWWNGAKDMSTSNNCVTLYSSGFYAVPCESTQGGHICQYNVQTNGRRPQLEEKDSEDDDDDDSEEE